MQGKRLNQCHLLVTTVSWGRQVRKSVCSCLTCSAQNASTATGTEGLSNLVVNIIIFCNSEAPGLGVESRSVSALPSLLGRELFFASKCSNHQLLWPERDIRSAASVSLPGLDPSLMIKSTAISIHCLKNMWNDCMTSFVEGSLYAWGKKDETIWKALNAVQSEQHVYVYFFCSTG